QLKTGNPPDYINLNEIVPSESSYISQPDISEYFASLTPQIVVKDNTKDESVDNIFDSIRNTVPVTESKLYFIKRKYYTEENIVKGKNFFETNCAVCHGKEADGMGFRAGTMYDAKPRMLTNLHWIDTR